MQLVFVDLDWQMPKYIPAPVLNGLNRHIREVQVNG
jgi:hypothetical protein